MSRRRVPTWRPLAESQRGLVARRQLLELGFDHHYVEAQVRSERWQLVSDVVACTTTGELSRVQLMWAGVLHAGPGSVVAGRTAMELAGLRGWAQDDVRVTLAKSHDLEPVAGIDFRESRRALRSFATTRSVVPGLPVLAIEPAALLVAGYELEPRAAFGLLAAVVQQRLSSPASLERYLARLHPLRRAKEFRAHLHDIAGGVHSSAERDVTQMCRAANLPPPRRQTRRRDASGRWRYTDAEWVTSLGRVVMLEVDGSFHMEAEHWIDDMERERDLITPGRTLIRCSAWELREAPEPVVAALRRLGVLPLAA